MIDVTKAMLDPTMVFKEPEDVVASNETTRTQQIETLRRWEYDARQLEVAEEDAGMAVRRPEMFDRVLQALHRLGGDRDSARQGGGNTDLPPQEQRRTSCRCSLGMGAKGSLMLGAMPPDDQATI